MEKTLKIIMAVLCFVIATETTLSAQELPPYWQGRIKLADKAFASMTEVEPQLAISTFIAFALYEKENGGMDELQELLFKEEILAAAGIGAYYDRASSFTQYARNQELKNIFKSYVEKLNALDKTKTASDTEWEKMMKLRQRKGTISQVVAQVKKEFEKWATKGDYEKTVQYEQRLNTEGIAVFDSLCAAKSIEVWNKSDYGKLSKSKYDADKEAYTYTLTYGDTILGMHQTSNERAVPLDTVSKYSDNDRVYDKDYIIEMQVHNGFVLPKAYEFNMRYAYGGQLDHSFMSLSIPDAQELKICFSDIQFEYKNINNNLKQHCFSYPAYRKAKEEKEKRLEATIDSLHQIKISFRDRLERIGQNDGSARLRAENILREISFSKDDTRKKYLQDPNGYLKELNALKKRINYLEQVIEQERQKREEEREREATLMRLRPIENQFYAYSQIKKVTCNNGKIAFTLPDKTEISGVFHYDEKISRHCDRGKSIYVSEQGDMMLYTIMGYASFGFSREKKVALLVGNNIYRLSNKHMRKLEECGQFKFAND